MSQLAENLQPQRQRVQNPNPTPEKTRRTNPEPKRRLITRGEKLLWSLGALTIMGFATTMISKEAALYNMNYDIHGIQAKIDSASNTNNQLQVQVTELKAPDRLIRIARELGLTLNNKNVQVLPK